MTRPITAPVSATPKPATPRPAPSPTHADLPGAIDALRRLAMENRLAPRVEPERECALLRTAPEAAAVAYARALLRILPAATGRRIAFHRPGAACLTFDEAWLLRLLAALAEGDAASAQFAIRSRIGRAMRGPVRFLAAGLAARLDNRNLEPF
jgi:hypothetical protein